VSWQDRLFADDQRHLAVVRIAEGEANAVAAQLLDLGDALVVEAQLRRALLAHHVEGVDHVVGGDRLTVVPACLRAQVEDDPRAILGHLHRLGEQAVTGERLVSRSHGQRIVETTDAGHGLALDDEGVEGVEAADVGEAHVATLRRIGVDVVEMREVGRVFRAAVHGQGMHQGLRTDRGRDQQQKGKQRYGAGPGT
jgi:hypothetical protein